MADFMDLLQGQLSDSMLEQLSNSIGADTQQTKAATDGILSTILSGLAKNASTPDGASALSNALDRDHDGSILDDLMGYIGGAKQPQNASMMNGAGILKHILGGKQGGAIDMISQMSGLGGDKTGNLMAMLAPMILGALGKQKRQNNMDQSSISDFLTKSVQSATNQRQEMGMIGKFLDQDGDGSVMDDLAGMGMKMFGKFLKK